MYNLDFITAWPKLVLCEDVPFLIYSEPEEGMVSRNWPGLGLHVRDLFPLQIRSKPSPVLSVFNNKSLSQQKDPHSGSFNATLPNGFHGLELEACPRSHQHPGHCPKSHQ